MCNYVAVSFLCLMTYSVMQTIGAYLRYKNEQVKTKSKMDAIKHQSEQETQKLQSLSDKMKNRSERKYY